jgi:hypothetical protein
MRLQPSDSRGAIGAAPSKKSRKRFALFSMKHDGVTSPGRRDGYGVVRRVGIFDLSRSEAPSQPSPSLLEVNADAPKTWLERNKLTLFCFLHADPFRRKPARSRRTANQPMAPGQKIGLDKVNSDLFPAGEPSALSLFTDFTAAAHCPLFF